MPAAKVWWAVQCKIHGNLSDKSNQGKWLKVPDPKGKQERKNRGCPKCKTEIS